MPQDKPETAFTVQNMLGTKDSAPLPKKPEPKKTSGLKKTLKALKWAAYGALGVAAGFAVKAGVDHFMEPAPAITQPAQAKVPTFNPKTLQQQVSNIVTQMKAYNNAHPDKPYSPQQIEQAQRDFVNNIEYNEMLKTANPDLSRALDAFLLTTLKTNLKSQDVTKAIVTTNAQIIEMVKGHQNPRTHSNHVLIPALGKYVNLANAKQDHTGATISEERMFESAIKSRMAAAKAFLTGHTNTQAIQLLDTFRGIALSPDLKFTVEKSDYERKAASDRAVENVSKKMHENIEKGQEPFTALCNAAQNVTGIDMNSRATPPAYIAKAYGTATQELTGKSSWVGQISAKEKPTPSLPSIWKWIGLVGAGALVVGGGSILWETRNKGEGLSKIIEDGRKKKKSEAAKQSGEIDRAKQCNVLPGYTRPPQYR